MTSTLLSSYSGCTGSGCTSSGSSLTGDISISPDPDKTTIASPVDVTDLVEVSGACQDLNRRNNRILVQVFESEDTASTPYIDNSIDTYCQDSVSTAEFRSAVSGATTIKQQCLFLTNGVGLSDPETEDAKYPQCFNGRFSFKVRLGRVMRKDPYIADITDANPLVSYIVRIKLRTIENGILSDTAWNNIPVTRYIAKPLVEAVGDTTAIRVKLKVTPAKFRDIRYTIKYNWEGPTSVLTVSGTPVGFTNSVSGTLVTHKKADFPIKSDGTSIDDYWHDGFPLSAAGLMPGAKYTYTITGADFNYDYLTFPGPGVIDSGNATTVVASVPAAQILNYAPDIANTNSCRFDLSGYNGRTGSPFSIEWRYSTSSVNWMTTDPNSGLLLPNTTCRGGTSCYVTGGTVVLPATMAITPNTPYYFAARSYIDTNANSQWDPGEFVGEWSSATGVSSSTGQVTVMNTCTFRIP